MSWPAPLRPGSVLLVVLWLVAAPEEAHGQDTIFTASARTKDVAGQGVIPRFTYVQATNVFDGNSRQPNPEQLGLRAFVETIGVVYGVTEDVTLAVTLPIIEEEFRRTVGGERVKLRANGIGDVPVLAKWRLLARREQTGTLEAAFLGGLELPTGDDGASGDGRRLPPPLRLGSGSIDAIAGGALTWIDGRLGLNADVIYKANSEANDVRLGNILRFDLGPNFRIYPGRYERSDEFTLYGILELNGVYAERDEVSGERVLNSGGQRPPPPLNGTWRGPRRPPSVSRARATYRDS